MSGDMRDVGDDELTLTSAASVAEAVHDWGTGNDPEGQHWYEDCIWRAVLRSIADGTAEDPVAMAAIALTTWDDEQRVRWYA